jgi:hypothetical protein
MTTNSLFEDASKILADLPSPPKSTEAERSERDRPGDAEKTFKNALAQPSVDVDEALILQELRKRRRRRNAGSSSMGRMGGIGASGPGSASAGGGGASGGRGKPEAVHVIVHQHPDGQGYTTQHVQTPQPEAHRPGDIAKAAIAGATGAVVVNHYHSDGSPMHKVAAHVVAHAAKHTPILHNLAQGIAPHAKAFGSGLIAAASSFKSGVHHVWTQAGKTAFAGVNALHHAANHMGSAVHQHFNKPASSPSSPSSAASPPAGAHGPEAKPAPATEPPEQRHQNPEPAPPQHDLSDIAAQMKSNLAGTARPSDKFMSATQGSHDTPVTKPAPWKRGQLPNEPSMPMGESAIAVTPSDYPEEDGPGEYPTDDGENDDPAFDDESGDRVDGSPGSAAASYIKPNPPSDAEIDEIIQYYASSQPALRTIVEHFKDYITGALELAGHVADYSRSKMAKDMIVKEPFDGSNIALMHDRLAKKYRIDPEKLAEALDDYARIQADTPEEDLSNTEYEIDGSNQSNILLNPSLEIGGSSMDSEHEIDPKQAMRNHLKRRIQARRYMAQAAADKSNELDNTVDDEDLEGCGVDPGTEHGAWQDILKKRRERIKSDAENRQDVMPGGAGVNGISGSLNTN